MVIFIMENGKMVKHTAKELKHQKMVIFIMENG